MLLCFYIYREWERVLDARAGSRQGWSPRAHLPVAVTEVFDRGR